MNVSAAKDNQIARFTVCARAADHENFSPQHYAWNLFPFPFCLLQKSFSFHAGNPLHCTEEECFEGAKPDKFMTLTF